MFIFDKFIVELVTDLGPSSLTVLYSRLSFNKPLYTTRGLLVVAKSEKVASLSKPHDTYSSSCSSDCNTHDRSEDSCFFSPEGP